MYRLCTDYVPTMYRLTVANNIYAILNSLMYLLYCTPRNILSFLMPIVPSFLYEINFNNNYNIWTLTTLGN